MQKKSVYYCTLVVLVLLFPFVLIQNGINSERHRVAGIEKKSVRVIFRFKVEETIVETCRYFVSDLGGEDLIGCKVNDR